MFRFEIVSAWSMNQCNPFSGTSRSTASYTSKARVMDSSYVAWRRNGHLFLSEKSDDHLEFLLHRSWEVRPWLQEVFKIRGGENQHFAGAIVAKVIVTLPGLHHASPAFEVCQFAFGFLCEEIVGNADR